MKFIICYYEYNPKMADRLFMELMAALTKNGIDIVRTSTKLMTIYTAHTYVQFVTDPIKLRGRRPDEVFTRDTIDDVLDSVLEQEGVKR